jgi:hypothetical protein
MINGLVHTGDKSISDIKCGKGGNRHSDEHSHSRAPLPDIKYRVRKYIIIQILDKTL